VEGQIRPGQKPAPPREKVKEKEGGRGRQPGELWRE